MLDRIAFSFIALLLIAVIGMAIWSAYSAFSRGQYWSGARHIMVVSISLPMLYYICRFVFRSREKPKPAERV